MAAAGAAHSVRPDQYAGRKLPAGRGERRLLSETADRSLVALSCSAGFGSEADSLADRCRYRLLGREKILPRVQALLDQALRHGPDVEGVGARAVLKLLPRDRRRDGGPGTCAGGIGAHRRRASPVAQIIDEDLAF